MRFWTASWFAAIMLLVGAALTWGALFVPDDDPDDDPDHQGNVHDDFAAEQKAKREAKREAEDADSE